MNTYDVITLPNESILVFSVPGAVIPSNKRSRDLKTIALATLCISLLHIGLWFII